MTVTALDLRMNLKKLVSLSQRFRTLTHSLAQPGPVACLARFVLPGCLLISKSGSDVGSDAQRVSALAASVRGVRRRRPAIGQADLREGRGREGVQVNEARWLLKR